MPGALGGFFVSTHWTMYLPGTTSAHSMDMPWKSKAAMSPGIIESGCWNSS